MDYWQRLSDKLEFVLGAGTAYWQEPTDPQRLRLFCLTLDELRSQVEMEMHADGISVDQGRSADWLR